MLNNLTKNLYVGGIVNSRYSAAYNVIRVRESQAVIMLCHFIVVHFSRTLQLHCIVRPLS